VQIRNALDLLGDRGVLAILHVLTSGPAGFNEISRQTALNPSTLSRRLAQLEEEDVVAKTITSTMPPKGEYRMSTSGTALVPVIKAIVTWALNRRPRSTEP
jgi:DNA-binding HxlR family transcriptional regulator